LTGIDVNVDGPANLALNDRLGTELFEMTAEALSNVRRHTSARRAAVSIQRTDHTIALRVENDAGDDQVQPFAPRSLEEHAQALGGSLDVQHSRGTTAVVISIPL
jgi:signal transduction histidine kinase